MDLRTAIHAEISEGSYACLVCHNDIDSRSPIWSCHSCFRSFDIACIRDWSKRDSAKAAKWRCPHCLSPQNVKPGSIRYQCWCGKTTNPSKNSSHATSDPWAASMASVVDSVPPHSCGQTCGAKRACPHPCPLVCHAGPHLDSAQCLYEGPVIKCFCGKHSEQRLCSESRYGGYSCGSSCGRRHAKCGHACERACHKVGKARRGQDPCGPCRAKLDVTCFCGRMKKTTRVCKSLPDKARKDIKTKWPNKLEGHISCGKPCSALLRCGHHKCNAACHPKEALSHECPLKPFEGETCFCGKVVVHREKCTDPKVSCTNACGRLLECGHTCSRRCHDGPCSPCEVVLANVPCRCKRTTHTTTCYAARHDPPECEKPCGALLSCRRHECRRKCCEFAPKNKKSHSSSHRRGQTLTLGELIANGGSAAVLQSEEPVSEAEEAAHLCTRICGKTLGCGIHDCVQPCHSGACPPCLAASFDEWSCPCGRTRVEPPIRCGTTMPTCRFTCHRAQACGHAAQHECHSDSVPCAPCPIIVSTRCKCGKSKVPVRCSQRTAEGFALPECMEPCGCTLACGHICTRRCCEGGTACLPCTKPCGFVYESCGHAHGAVCHFPQECPDQCVQDLVARCPCGVLQLPYKCGEDIEIGCNDVCVRESYPLIVLDAYEEDKAWCTNIEIQLRAFVLQKPPARTFWFKPMNRKRRRVVYYLLEHYGMEGQSMDEGANRSICAYRTSKTWLPKTRLSQARRKRPEVEIILDESEDDSDANVSEQQFDDPDSKFALASEEHAQFVADSFCSGSELPGDGDDWQSAPASSRHADKEARHDSEKASKSSFSKLSRSFSLLSFD